MMYARNQRLKLHQEGIRGRKAQSRKRPSHPGEGMQIGSEGVVESLVSLVELGDSRALEMGQNPLLNVYRNLQIQGGEIEEGRMLGVQGEDVHVNIDDDYEEAMEIAEDDGKGSSEKTTTFRTGEGLGPREEEDTLLGIDEVEEREEEEEEEDEDEDRENENIHASSVAVKPKRAPRVQWTEERDRYSQFFISLHEIGNMSIFSNNETYFTYECRQLIAVYGLFLARYQKMQWTDAEVKQKIPFQPEHCRRRVTSMKSDPRTRQAIANFVALMTSRYHQYMAWKRVQLAKKHETFDPRGAIDTSIAAWQNVHSTKLQEKASNTPQIEPQWDPTWEWNDLSHPTVASTLDKVIKVHNQVKSWMSKPRGGTLGLRGKLLVNQKVPGGDTGKKGKQSEEKLDENEEIMVAGIEPKSEGQFGSGEGASVKLSRGPQLTSAVQNSVKVASAIELIKAMLLNSTPDGQYPELFVSMLKNYKSHEIATAFEFLRENNFVVSQCFSPFAVDLSMLKFQVLTLPVLSR